MNRIAAAVLSAALAVGALVTGAPTALADEVDTRVILRPGDGIARSSDEAAVDWCSVGAIGRDNAGRLVAISAGHCDLKNVDAPIYKVGERAAGPIGVETDVVSRGAIEDSLAGRQFGLPSTKAPDYAVILLDETKVRGSNTSTPDAFGKTVTLTNIGGALPLQGGNNGLGEHCGVGYTSRVYNGQGAQCSGRVLYAYDTREMIWSWDAMLNGDSGGTFARTATNTWMGIATGFRYFDVPSFVFQRADKIVAYVNATGSYGAGFTLVTEQL